MGAGGTGGWLQADETVRGLNARGRLQTRDGGRSWWEYCIGMMGVERIPVHQSWHESSLSTFGSCHVEKGAHHDRQLVLRVTHTPVAREVAAFELFVF